MKIPSPCAGKEVSNAQWVDIIRRLACAGDYARDKGELPGPYTGQLKMGVPSFRNVMMGDLSKKENGARRN